jgi:Ca2+-binding RTX toxin-like protein
MVGLLVATIDVSNATQLTAALSAAKGGDTIRLAGGNYGDVNISGKSYASDVTIMSKDPANSATFNTLVVKNSSNIDFTGIDVNFTPTTSTLSFTSAVMVDSSKGIEFTGGEIHGGPSVNGVSALATIGDATGNVLGKAVGRGMTIQNSTDVRVEKVDIAMFDRGVVLANNNGVVITHNEIHDLRRSGIVGMSDNLTIQENHLSSSQPWRWGLTNGDHADFIALWTDKSAVSNIIIRNNIMEQGDGAPILGMWVGGSAAAPFKNVVVDGNAILGTDHQGIMLTWVLGGALTDNTLVKTAGGSEAPGILIREGSTGIETHGNYTAFLQDKSGGANNVHDNVLVQTASAAGAGYTPGGLLTTVAGMTNAETIYSTILKAVPLTGTTAYVSATSPFASVVKPTESTADQTLIGSSSANAIAGGSGDDTIDGRGGSDTLVGGAGNDVYILPNSLAKIIEAAGGGVDTVIATGDYTLGANLENLSISTVAGNNWGGVGNELNNVLTGNAGGNRLSGMGGADTLDGGQGNDFLLGGDGDDSLIGGAGSDTMSGGAGKDVFQIGAGSGIDRVIDFTSVDRISVTGSSSYTAAQVGADTVVKLNTGEQLTLAGVKLTALSVGWIEMATAKAVATIAAPTTAPTTAATLAAPTVAPAAGLSLVGSSGNNALIGGAGNDTLDGRGGYDTLTGGAGNDTYIVQNSLSTLVEKGGEGTDTVVAKGDFTLGFNFENLTINGESSNSWGGTGNELNNVITGNGGANRLDGMAGADTINGGAGNDFIYGGAGADHLSGELGVDSLIGGGGADIFQMGRGYGMDRVTDFSYAEGDRLKVSGVSSYTAKQVGADTVVDLGGGDQITLANVNMAALGGGWIVLG